MKRAVTKLFKAAGTGAALLGATGLILGAYALIVSYPDMKRYIKISTM